MSGIFQFDCFLVGFDAGVWFYLMMKDFLFFYYFFLF